MEELTYFIEFLRVFDSHQLWGLSYSHRLGRSWELTNELVLGVCPGPMPTPLP